MKKLSLIMAVVISTAMMFSGCEKEEFNEVTTDLSQNLSKTKVNNFQKSMALEDYFEILNEDQTLYADYLLGELSVIIVDEVTTTDPTIPELKEFNDNHLGQVAAAKYANKLMDKGKCVKAWKDNGKIYVDEIPC